MPKQVFSGGHKLFPLTQYHVWCIYILYSSETCAVRLQCYGEDQIYSHILWYLLTTMQIAFSSNITFIHVCARYIRYVLPILMQNKPKKFCIEFLKYLMALEITLLNNEDAFLQPSFAYFATLLELPTPWCTNATFQDS